MKYTGMGRSWQWASTPPWQCRPVCDDRPGAAGIVKSAPVPARSQGGVAVNHQQHLVRGGGVGSVTTADLSALHQVQLVGRRLRCLPAPRPCHGPGSRRPKLTAAGCRLPLCAGSRRVLRSAHTPSCSRAAAGRVGCGQQHAGPFWPRLAVSLPSISFVHSSHHDDGGRVLAGPPGRSVQRRPARRHFTAGSVVLVSFTARGSSSRCWVALPRRYPNRAYQPSLCVRVVEHRWRCWSRSHSRFQAVEASLAFPPPRGLEGSLTGSGAGAATTLAHRWRHRRATTGRGAWGCYRHGNHRLYQGRSRLGRPGAGSTGAASTASAQVWAPRAVAGGGKRVYQPSQPPVWPDGSGAQRLQRGRAWLAGASRGAGAGARASATARRGRAVS